MLYSRAQELERVEVGPCDRISIGKRLLFPMQTLDANRSAALSRYLDPDSIPLIHQTLRICYRLVGQLVFRVMPCGPLLP